MAGAPTWATRLRSVIRGGADARLRLADDVSYLVQWALLVVLGDLADDEGLLHPNCEPTVASLGAQIRIDERTARRGLRALADADLVLVTKPAGAAWRYALNTKTIETAERAPHRWAGHTPVATPPRALRPPGHHAPPTGDETPPLPGHHAPPLLNGLGGLDLDRKNPESLAGVRDGGIETRRAEVDSPQETGTPLPAGEQTWFTFTRRLAEANPQNTWLQKIWSKMEGDANPKPPTERVRVSLCEIAKEAGARMAPNADLRWLMDHWRETRLSAHLDALVDPEPSLLVKFWNACEQAATRVAASPNKAPPTTKDFASWGIWSFLREKQDRAGGLADQGYPFKTLAWSAERLNVYGVPKQGFAEASTRRSSVAAVDLPSTPAQRSRASLHHTEIPMEDRASGAAAAAKISALLNTIPLPEVKKARRREPSTDEPHARKAGTS